MRTRRRRLALLGVALASLGATLLRRRSRRTDRLELYFQDGSLVSLDEGAPDAGRLVSLGRDVLRVAAGSNV